MNRAMIGGLGSPKLKSSLGGVRRVTRGTARRLVAAQNQPTARSDVGRKKKHFLVAATIKEKAQSALIAGGEVNGEEDKQSKDQVNFSAQTRKSKR